MIPNKQADWRVIVQDSSLKTYLENEKVNDASRYRSGFRFLPIEQEECRNSNGKR